MDLISKHNASIDFMDNAPKGSIRRWGGRRSDGTKDVHKKKKTATQLAKSNRSKQQVSHHVDKATLYSYDQFDYNELVRNLHWDCTYFCSYYWDDESGWSPNPSDLGYLPPLILSIQSQLSEW
jgi:hypothetical protein